MGNNVALRSDELIHSSRRRDAFLTSSRAASPSGALKPLERYLMASFDLDSRVLRACAVCCETAPPLDGRVLQRPGIPSTDLLANNAARELAEADALHRGVATAPLSLLGAGDPRRLRWLWTEVPLAGDEAPNNFCRNDCLRPSCTVAPSEEFAPESKLTHAKTQTRHREKLDE